MMKGTNFLLLFFISLLSCNNQESIVITRVEDNKDAIVFPTWQLDSVDIYMPYTFHIINNSFNELDFFTFKYKSDGKPIETRYLVIENEKIETMYSYDNDKISAMSAKNFTIYLKNTLAKKDVPERYWKPMPSEQALFRQVLDFDFNKINVVDPYYVKLRRRMMADSLAFGFQSGDKSTHKTCNLGQFTFKTVTSEDILKNEELGRTNIFKP